jgi:ADP-ribose pyrophosphatase YjhB (NUDIX family)
MNKFKEIRPLALGIARKNGKVLVTEGTDTVKGNFFYRCLGGGIEFLEKGAETLKREFQEEIGINIEVKDLLGVCENIFTFEGKNAHELILFYDIAISDSDYKDE